MLYNQKINNQSLQTANKQSPKTNNHNFKRIKHKKESEMWKISSLQM